MALIHKFEPPGGVGPKNKKAKKYRLEFSSTGLIVTVVLSVVGLAWIFLLGVLVGRGYTPENAVPEIADFMPKEQPFVEEPMPPAGGSADATAKKPAAAEEKVIAPEELEFHKELAKKPAATPPVVEAPALTAKKPAPPAPAPVPKAVEKPLTAAQIHLYEYQAASYGSRSAAEAFQKRLSEKGVPTDIETADVKGKKVYRVIVGFTGSEKRAAEVLTVLSGLGVKKPLLRKKKAL
jgi:septal ring-binding cell division protein DamX